ncbi:MAG: GntR family transcriptional regulator [Clostridia bacterium]|nr:GntR family transcriptional regulator [Clostridia bacterium]
MIYQPDSSDKSSLRGKVFNAVRESILEGKYKAGDVLRETVIANELNVSRTPVREAIRQLELEGLVQSIPNKETIVAGVSKEDVQDIFMIRNKLEGLAGRRAAERITQEEIEQMEEVLALTAFYIAKNDIDHINELDHKFHDIIYKATKSKILKHMLSDFHSYVQNTRKESIATPGRAKRLLEEHTGIYDAIRERNAEKVEMLITKHVQNVTMNMHL